MFSCPDQQVWNCLRCGVASSVELPQVWNCLRCGIASCEISSGDPFQFFWGGKVFFFRFGAGEMPDSPSFYKRIRNKREKANKIIVDFRSVIVETKVGLVYFILCEESVNGSGYCRYSINAAQYCSALDRLRDAIRRKNVEKTLTLEKGCCASAQ
ncbi:hypothetical protein ElyMa_003628800 [Elysia marginata]|uniref:RanBP2-type domain-containing protein n=1 Tax=Elysia marginata TaxID=1093978 RepID=A0AAV4EVZ1_9GAST|nr:hypothetical protein ElyMa_003628800 [Elysia marginata]